MRIRTLLFLLLLSLSLCSQKTPWRRTYEVEKVLFFPPASSSYYTFQRSFKILLLSEGDGEYIVFSHPGLTKKIKMGVPFPATEGVETFLIASPGVHGTVSFNWKKDVLYSVSLTDGFYTYVFLIQYPMYL